MHVRTLSLALYCIYCTSAYGACEVEAIAHRGDSYAAPENTLTAITGALNKNARLIEVDVRLSADGIPVLMHDADVDRTTNTQGPAAGFTVAELAALDAGGWHSPRFAGEPVPTLRQAIEAAQPSARLYLDVKVDGFAASLAKMLEESKLPPDSIVVAVSDANALSEFHAALPKTPLAWFGVVPDDWDSAWFDMLQAHNVQAIELYWPTLQRLPSVEAFVAQAKKRNIAVWTYLLNDTEHYRAAIGLGVSGIETDFPELLATACDDSSPRFGPLPRIAGQWDFNHGDLRAATGSQLVAVQLLRNELAFGTTADLGLPPLAGGLGRAARVGGLKPNQSLIMYPNMHPAGKGNGEFINRYTLVMDILRPAQAQGRWNALLQTDIYNRSDADLFIDPENRIGANGSYHGRIELDRWQRIAATVDLLTTPNGEMRLFIDGRRVGIIELDGLDGRWSIYSTLSSLGTLLFSDENNETALLYVSSIQIRNYAMTDNDVAALGSPTASGIPATIPQTPHD